MDKMAFFNQFWAFLMHSLRIRSIFFFLYQTMTDEINTWRSLRNELDEMLKARDMKYADAVREYYKKNPKDFSEKKTSHKKINQKNLSDDDVFSFENSVEKKYWRKPPKNEKDIANDKPDANRIVPAIIFFEKLKKFILSIDCPKPEQWIVEHLGQDFMDRFRREVILPVKKEMEDSKYKSVKDENGMDEFDF